MKSVSASVRPGTTSSPRQTRVSQPSVAGVSATSRSAEKYAPFRLVVARVEAVPQHLLDSRRARARSASGVNFQYACCR